MAQSGGGKNAILLIIAVAAIGGAIYGIMSMKTTNVQDEQLTYFIDPESVMNDPQDVAILTNAQLKTRRNDQLLSTPEADKRRRSAGQCPHCDKYFPLVGHGGFPPSCPVCEESLEDDD